MKSINALSLTANANHWLESSQRPRVLHVFDRVCSLINEHGDVLSIVTTEIGDGPFNLVIENLFLFSEHIGIDSPVSCLHHSIAIDHFIIRTDDTKLWNPRPKWETLHCQREDISKHLESFYRVPRVLPISQSLVSSLSAAVAAADASTSSAIASQLAGLGIGLTPTGDDILLGTLYAAWIIHPLEVMEPLASEIAKTAAPLTTSLSAAWLRAAGKGEAGLLWHELFEALVSSNDHQIKAGIDKILGVGATSGADALTGFIGTLHAYREPHRKYVIP